jgi:hypothetical protein
MSAAFLKVLGSLVLIAVLILVVLDTLGDARTATADLAQNAGQAYCSNFGGLCE